MKSEKIIALAGNPNVGKSTIFNSLTGMKQHTGNWPGKTVSCARGRFTYQEQSFALIDLPGTYSLTAHSAEEEVARDFLRSGRADAVVVVCDATCLERNLNLVLQILEITFHVIVCINLMDEAKKKGIHIQETLLEKRLGVPVVKTAAHNRKSLKILLDAIQKVSGESNDGFMSSGAECPGCSACHCSSCFDCFSCSGCFPGSRTEERRTLTAETLLKDVLTMEKPLWQLSAWKLDKILTGRLTAYPIMVLLLTLLLWITIVGANYPSEFLSSLLFRGQDLLTELFTFLHAPDWLHDMLVLGIYRVVAWVVSVMLPPMAIFFPLFTLLEDAGYLPRMAYNLDKPFQCCHACGKQALTMAMGFGCNAVGVMGCRIIDSPRERLLAMLTNVFVPCNGRFPLLIAMFAMFFTGAAGSLRASALSALLLTLVILLGIGMTFAVTWLLSVTLLKGVPSSFTLELPPYRKPQILTTLIRSVFDRTLFVLGRAVAVAAPAGLLIWILGNTMVGTMSLLNICASLLDPPARLMGLDGVILLAFFLGFPANEIVMPIILMAYLAQGTLVEPGSLMAVKELLTAHGWTFTTAGSVVLFSLMHWPCSTTLLTIYKESKSLRWTALSALLPTAAGAFCCILFTGICRLAGF